jgi:hypothetical protein
VGNRAIISAVGLLAAVYVVVTPYVTVYQIRAAAESHDGEALSEYIDFPSVRQSLKDQMNAAFLNNISNDKNLKNDPFAPLGLALGGVMIDKLVEVYVTPAGITQLMAGETPKADGQPSGSNSGRKPLPIASMSYESLSKFVVNA